MNHNKAAFAIFMGGIVYQGFIAPVLHGIFGGDFSSNLDFGTLALNVLGAMGSGTLHTIEKFKGIVK